MRRLLLSISLSLLITNTAIVAAQSDDPGLSQPTAGGSNPINMESASVSQPDPRAKEDASAENGRAENAMADIEKPQPEAQTETQMKDADATKVAGVEQSAPTAETETAPKAEADARRRGPMSSGDETKPTVEAQPTKAAETEVPAMPADTAETHDKPKQEHNAGKSSTPSSGSGGEERLRTTGAGADLNSSPSESRATSSANEGDTNMSGMQRAGSTTESAGATTGESAEDARDDSSRQVAEMNSEPVQVEAEQLNTAVMNQIAELKTRSEQTGPKEVDSVATEAESLGAKLSAQSFPEEATQCYEMAYQARARIVDKEDPSLLPSIFGQANCNFHSTDYDNSIKWFQQALIISEKLSPEKEDEKYEAISQGLKGLAGCYLIQGNGQSAYPYCQRMYEMTRTRYGAESTQVFWSAAQLGECYRVRGMKEELKKFMDEMFYICLERAGGKEQFMGNEPTNHTVEQFTPHESSAQSQAVLPLRFWSPSNQPARAVLICVHGMCLHAGSYEDLALEMRKKGFLVVGLDVRGFGSWMGSQGQDYLNLNGCLADIHHIVGKFNQMLPGVPIFLVGESMGGGIVLHAAANDADSIAGIISSVPVGQRFAQKSEAISVAFHLPLGIHHNMNIGKSLLKRATQNPSVRLRWQSDNLARMLVSPGELISFQHFMNENPKYAKTISDKPVLVVQGMQDRLVKPQATVRLFEEIPSRDKTLLTRKEGEHLTFEMDQFSPDVVNQLSAWIDRHSVKREAKGAGQI